MSIGSYNKVDDLDFNTSITSFDFFHGTSNKEVIKKTDKTKHQIKQELDALNEKRFLDKQLDSFSDYWEV